MSDSDIIVIEEICEAIKTLSCCVGVDDNLDSADFIRSKLKEVYNTMKHIQDRAKFARTLEDGK